MKLERCNAREAAFLSVMASMSNERFVSDFLEEWHRLAKPQRRDWAFAQEVAYGTVRMALALDHIAEKLSDKGRLKLKVRERVLLRTALYQHVFMDRVPAYAIASETIVIAKKVCNSRSIPFLNAVLRKLSDADHSLPEEKTPAAMSVRYSYPEFFVSELIKGYGIVTSEEVMAYGNISPRISVRIRGNGKVLKGMTAISDGVAFVDDMAMMKDIVASDEYYIQNPTPISLLTGMCRHISPPRRVLDMCASPGGKALLVHDIFPDAELVVNDISEKKLQKLMENVEKYKIPAKVSCCRGEEFESAKLFDVIIIDAPCSNSGALSRRAEARWRLSEDAVGKLQQTQKMLIKHAKNLLAPEGKIFYMTCSILRSENEDVAGSAEYSETILPTKDGRDGGFACIVV